MLLFFFPFLHLHRSGSVVPIHNLQSYKGNGGGHDDDGGEYGRGDTGYHRSTGFGLLCGGQIQLVLYRRVKWTGPFFLTLIRYGTTAIQPFIIRGGAAGIFQTFGGALAVVGTGLVVWDIRTSTTSQGPIIDGGAAGTGQIQSGTLTVVDTLGRNL